MDCSPPGSSVHGIFQAGVLNLGAIAFSVMGLNQVLISRLSSTLSQHCDNQREFSKPYKLSVVPWPHSLMGMLGDIP